RRILPLNVSGPFHTRLMKEANEEFAASLNEVDVNDEEIPDYANVTAEPVKDRDEITDIIINKLYSPVRFETSIQNMLDTGVDALVEVGTGRVLSGLVKKIDRKAKIFSVQDEKSLEEFLTWYHEKE